jgi:TRAP-type uncharacterized transport system substrate-binding protein
VLEDVCVIAYDLYLTVGKGVPDDVVAAMMGALWDHPDKLRPLHPVFKEWTRERMPTHEITMPYHPGVIRFFKDKGVWTAEMERAQRQLLTSTP